MSKLNINNLPTPTWNWLKCNDIQVLLPDILYPASVEEEVPAEVRKIIINKNEIPQLEMSAGKEFCKYFEKQDISSVEFELMSGVKASGALTEKVTFGNEAGAAGRVYHVGKGSRLDIVHDFQNEKKSEFGAFDTRIVLDEEAEVDLIDVIRVSDDMTVVDNIGIRLAKNAHLHIFHILISGSNVITGCAVDLAGEDSTVNINSGYIVKNDENLDINYVVRHRGRHTDTKINVAGVLRDKATKTFRGSIDFINGCAESKGDEREDVLMMNPGVENKTIPLILCAEEDVEGTHGASIGKISDDVLFYFETRGVDEKDVQELMAKSRIDAVISKISDSAVRDRLKNILTPEE